MQTGGPPHRRAEGDAVEATGLRFGDEDGSDFAEEAAV